MKAVIRSCKPFWLYLILNGRKTIEVSKTKPISENWNKTVYMYCSNDKKSFKQIPEADQEWFSQFLGKVVCEFYCGGMMCSETLFMRHALGQHCVPIDELKNYASGHTLYGWRITNLKIYDTPKELSKFRNPCKVYEKGDGKCGDCDYWEYRNECACDGLKLISRPPQSWFYCEIKTTTKGE